MNRKMKRVFAFEIFNFITGYSKQTFMEDSCSEDLLC